MGSAPTLVGSLADSCQVDNDRRVAFAVTSSKNTHATKHFRATHHSIMQSFQPGETWRWCYVDQEIV